MGKVIRGARGGRSINSLLFQSLLSIYFKVNSQNIRNIHIQTSKQNPFQLFHRLVSIWNVLTSPVTLLLTHTLVATAKQVCGHKEQDGNNLTSSM